MTIKVKNNCKVYITIIKVAKKKSDTIQDDTAL